LGVEAVNQALEFGDVDDVVDDAGGAHGSAEDEVAGHELPLLRPAVVPLDGRVRVRLADVPFRPVRQHFGPVEQFGGDVPGLPGRVDAPEVADPGEVFGVLAEADVDAVVVDDRGG